MRRQKKNRSALALLFYINIILNQTGIIVIWYNIHALEGAIALWCASRKNAAVDLRLPLIQTLANSIEYSQGQHNAQSVPAQRELVYRIAHSMLHGVSHMEESIRQYFEAQKDQPDISQFIASLRVVSGMQPSEMVFDPTQYLLTILAGSTSFPGDVLGSIFQGGSWKVQYRIPNTTSWMTIESSDREDPNPYRITRGGTGIAIGEDYRITGRLVESGTGGFDRASEQLVESIYRDRTRRVMNSLSEDMRQKRAILRTLVTSIQKYISQLTESHGNATINDISFAITDDIGRCSYTSHIGLIQDATINATHIIHLKIHYGALFAEVSKGLSSMHTALATVSCFSVGLPSDEQLRRDAVESTQNTGCQLITRIDDFLSHTPEIRAITKG